jgi:hypothetical protein
MFYLELDIYETQEYLKKYDCDFSLGAIDFMGDELKWFNETDIPIIDIDLIKSRYEECSLLKFCELMDLEYDNFELEDMERWFSDFIDENISMESYLKPSNNLYKVLNKVDETTLSEIVQDYCNARSMSYRIINGDNIIFDWES